MKIMYEHTHSYQGYAISPSPRNLFMSGSSYNHPTSPLPSLSPPSEKKRKKKTWRPPRQIKCSEHPTARAVPWDRGTAEAATLAPRPSRLRVPHRAQLRTRAQLRAAHRLLPHEPRARRKGKVVLLRGSSGALPTRVYSCVWLLCYLQHFAVVTRGIRGGYDGERGGHRAFVGPKNGTRGSSRRARIPLNRGLRWMRGAGRPGRVGGHLLADCSERLGNNARGGTGLTVLGEGGRVGEKGGRAGGNFFYLYRKTADPDTCIVCSILHL